MGISVGDLNTKIEIMRMGVADDGHGAEMNTGWAPVATPWAQVIGQDGREAVISHALQGVSVYRVQLRFRRDLLPSDQIRLNGSGGIDLNIRSISDPTGRREQLMIIADTDGAQRTS